MATFTSSLPDSLLEKLSVLAKELKLPKNRLIENALELYLDQVEKASYIQSYKQAASDPDILLIAEEGMQEYFTELNDADSN
ncbi:ribbon-helix-helix domain-containing protein [Polaribacter butkevichii]|uniref:CopG family transcriptional regulator n=1 Tax=Polaribacter butkevichii TaxID=218490 RepID=A0A2P6CBT1_9FLAO|nr:ribbon-helix-helix domain-containing protein [Polaribacter butkevichii]PQJ72298.1 CopG family transcriptional regulator [Polaribacter butkevichii]